MSIYENQRPGVYSSYTVSPSYGMPRSSRAAAVVMKAAPSLSGTLHRFTGYAAAAEMLEGTAENNNLLSCMRILFKCGVSSVLVSAVDMSNGNAYGEALALIEDENDVGAVLCDAESLADLQALKSSVVNSSENMRERMAFISSDSAGDALGMARALNCERMVLCCPASVPADMDGGGSIFSAAAMAGMVISQNDPVYNWNGAAIAPLVSCAKLPEEDIQSLIAAGVTVFEGERGAVSCIRAVTTRTMTNSAEDNSLRSLNSVLIIDEVMRTVRDSLRGRLTGARLSMQSISSQVTIILDSCRDGGLIEQFDAPLVRQDGDDPAVCVVELGFKIAHVLSQIHISAHIRI